MAKATRKPKAARPRANASRTAHHTRSAPARADGKDMFTKAEERAINRHGDAALAAIDRAMDAISRLKAVCPVASLRGYLDATAARLASCRRQVVQLMLVAFFFRE